MRAFNSSPAKEPPLFRSTQTQPSYIDLTDDSYNEYHTGARGTSKAHSLQRGATASSNRGLILPGSPLHSTIKSEANDYGVYGQTRSFTPCHTYLSTHSHAGGRNGSLVGSESDVHIGRMNGHGHVRAYSIISNGAKRRKTDGSTSTAHQSVQPVTVFKHGIPIQATPTRVSLADKYQNDPKMHSVINDPVLKSIAVAISRYRNSIPKEDRDRIARQAAVKIVTQKDFIPNFEANNFSLSSTYKTEIAERAERYILKSAKELLPNLRTPKTSISSVRSSRSSSEEKSTSRAGDLEEQRQYSSSPTTSFTDVQEDNEDGPADQQAQAQFKTPAVSVPVRKSTRIEQTQRPTLSQQYTSTKDRRKSSSNSYTKPPPKSTSAGTDQLDLRSLDVGAKRPYLCFADREYTKRALGAISGGQREELIGHVLHVDFSPKELEFVGTILRSMVFDTQKEEPITSAAQITALICDHKLQIPQICSKIKAAARGPPGTDPGQQAFRRRDNDSIYSFLQDALAGRLQSQPQVLRVESRHKHRLPAPPQISTLLRGRETWGLAPPRASQGLHPFQEEFCNYLEDTLTRKSEWTDCCGDISAISWTSDDAFICGATAHSDFHNMQYNKPGNLGVGSCNLDTLRSVPDHRILRPVIGSAENNENSLEAMRQTQDPWLYTSVVSTSHSEFSGFTFTASFDQKVKVWQVSSHGSSINLVGTWEHDGKVNFVVTSKWHEKVATASDVCKNAIRIYDINRADVCGSSYKTYSGDRAQEQAMELERQDTWAYYPATIAWGIAPGVRNIVLVGYSPRSVSGHEMDIPEEKRNSGELCLWDTDGERIRISSAHLQNVFEVAWHQTQPMFIAATSPCGAHEPSVTKTQVRLFTQNEFGAFLQVKSLDCGASDINELTIMPNGSVHCYVTASCTDGNTYVWDTAQGDRPIHTLGHGESLDNPLHDVPREIADTGVKFASWGQASSRFYTGSSDGKVKAWDIKAPKGQAFIRTVLSVSGGISSGVFSKDFSKLLIGDSTGKVHLLEIDRDDLDDDTPQERAPTSFVKKKAPWLPNISGRRIPPNVIIPHRETTPPSKESSGPTGETAEEMGRAFLEEGQLRIHPDRRVGAVQGPNYAETMLYRFDAHEDNDCTKPLLPSIQSRQQYEVIRRRNNTLHLPSLPQVNGSSLKRHLRNIELDLNLSVAEQQGLQQDGVDLDFEPNSNFEYEMSIRTKKFKVQVIDKQERNSSSMSEHYRLSSLP